VNFIVGHQKAEHGRQITAIYFTQKRFRLAPDPPLSVGPDPNILNPLLTERLLSSFLIPHATPATFAISLLLISLSPHSLPKFGQVMHSFQIPLLFCLLFR
jgi:hypothetical protein